MSDEAEALKNLEARVSDEGGFRVLYSPWRFLHGEWVGVANYRHLTITGSDEDGWSWTLDGYPSGYTVETLAEAWEAAADHAKQQG